MDVASSSRRLSDFARMIMKPVSLDGLISVLPDAFELFLPSNIRCERVVIISDLLEGSGGSQARACLPLRCADEIVGVALISWDGDCTVEALGDPPLADAAELAAIAIANRQESEADREQARAAAAEVKFDLIGMLAHEMRTPLASIKGYSSALLLDEVTWNRSTMVEFLEAIDIESDRLSEMVHHMLDSTVIEAGMLELQREPAHLPVLVRKTVESLSRRTDNHRLLTSFADDFPPVYADPQRIQQVIINLVDNAIKYSPDGGLIVVRGSIHGNEVLVQVSDQGVGIAPEHLNKLFERFFRTEQKKIDGVSGTGLGLPIADSLVRAHGGRIWAESTVDSGTTLSFTLPVYTAGIEAGDDEHREH